MPHILCIGGTGHIGGAVLHRLLERHPEDDVQVTVLVQSEAKGRRLAHRYPRVRTLVGHTGEHDKMEAASRGADLVINTSPDYTHDEGIRAILRGLQGHHEQQKQPQQKPQKPSYYIHTSGASILWDEPRGSADARWWDDVADAGELRRLGPAHTHAVTDALVRGAGAAEGVRVAIVSPGFVGGLSPSLEHPTPITMPAIMTTTRAFGSGFQIAQGENISGWIHVMDLANMFLVLVDDALAALRGSSPAQPEQPEQLALWGPEAYYFGAAENVAFSDLMRALVPVLHDAGVVKSRDMASVDVAEAARISLRGFPGGKKEEGEHDAPPPDSWAMHIAIMYGINMRIRASRMARLGWRAEMGSVLEGFDEVVSRYLELEKEKA